MREGNQEARYMVENEREEGSFSSTFNGYLLPMRSPSLARHSSRFPLIELGILHLNERLLADCSSDATSGNGG